VTGNRCFPDFFLLNWKKTATEPVGMLMNNYTTWVRKAL
jgi:hypothetical protein